MKSPPYGGLLPGLEAPQVILNLRGVPVLRADEFAADDSPFVDDVGLGRACGSESEIGLLCAVEYDRHVVQPVVDDVLTVVLGVAIEGNGDDREIGNLLLELFE